MNLLRKGKPLGIVSAAADLLFIVQLFRSIVTKKHFMSGEPIILREFNDTELLQEYAELLKVHAIPFVIDDTKPRFDVTFANDESRRIFRLKVNPEDLQKAREVSAAADQKTMEELPADYYLFGFTDDELKDVLVKTDEWNAFDVLLAEKLLAERGVAIDQQQLEQTRSERIDLLDQPEDEKMLVIVCGYILSLGSLLGLFIALILLTSKKTNSEGKRVIRYSQATQRHAVNMLLIQAVAFVAGLSYMVLELG